MKIPYEDLLRQRVIESAEVTKEEVAEHLRVAKHDISVAQNIASIDLDWAFTVAYNGIRKSAQEVEESTLHHRISEP